MNAAEAKAILRGALREDGTISSFQEDTDLQYTHWDGHDAVTLDGQFSVEELEAILWAMRNRTVQP